MIPVWLIPCMFAFGLGLLIGYKWAMRRADYMERP